MEGYKKAKAVADELKEEKEAVEEKQLEAKEVAKNQLAMLAENEELVALYRQNAKVGAENIGGSAPYLRIHTATSTANELRDGTRPQVGNFFYNVTKQEYKEITAHILTISRGFRMWQEDKVTGKKKLQFNQLVGGVIVDAGEFKPFIMYVNGLKLQPVWKFGKEAAQYTRSGIPMFAMVVKLTTEEVKSDYGYKWVPKIEIVKENGQPELVMDIETFQQLRNGVTVAEDTINGLIEANATSEEGQLVPDGASGVVDQENI